VAQVPGGDADAGRASSSDPALFGRLVALGQAFSLGEALSKNAAQAEAHLARLCEEGRKLRERPAVPEPGSRERDAAQFMADLVDYEMPLHDPPGRLHLPDALRARVGSYGADWLTRVSDADLAGLDFAWLDALAQYDHWTVLAAGRLRDRQPDNAFLEPIPNYASLMAWAKLRYALALRQGGDLLAASAQVRHLAELIHSQQLLISEMVANAIYKLDARAREVVAASGGDVSRWGALDLDQLDRARRVSRAAMYFTYPGVSPDVVQRAVQCMHSPCVALLEGAGANRSFGHHGATDNLPLLRDLSRGRGCDATLFDRMVAGRELAAGEALEIAAQEMDGQIGKFLGD
jgi:hypothetical protein